MMRHLLIDLSAERNDTLSCMQHARNVWADVMDDHEWIKGALRRRGSSLVDVARIAGVTASAVYYVCKGKSRSTRVEEAISTITGYSPAELWPNRPPTRTNSGGAMTRR